jgi:hypothetical protein
MANSDQSARDTATSVQGAEAGATPGETAREYVPRQASRHTGRDAGTGGPVAATGLTLAAAVLMIISGVWNFMEGLAAVIRGSFFIVLPNYAYNISITGWGWFHLILGAVVAVAGVALLTNRLWARIIGIIIVSVSMVVNFLYIPYQPVWSIALIALDAAVIWALLASSSDHYA